MSKVRAYILDRILMGPSVWLSVLGLESTRCSHTERCIAGKRHEDPMSIGALANVKYKGQTCSGAIGYPQSKCLHCGTLLFHRPWLRLRDWKLTIIM